METKFDIGEKVFYIYQKTKQIWDKCRACDGKRVIVLLDYQEYLCPSCHGRSTQVIYKKFPWLVEDGYVTSISYIASKIIDEGDDNSVMVEEKVQVFKDVDYDYDYEKYTDSEMPVELVYKNRVVAQAECDRRNKQENLTGENDGN